MPLESPDHDPKRRGRFARAATPGQGAAYEGAMEAVFSILVAVGLGYWADSHFETGPRYLIVGALIGFAAFVLRLSRMSKLVHEASQAAVDAASKDQETSAQRSVASRLDGEDRILPRTDRRPSGGEGRAD